MEFEIHVLDHFLEEKFVEPTTDFWTEGIDDEGIDRLMDIKSEVGDAEEAFEDYNEFYVKECDNAATGEDIRDLEIVVGEALPSDDTTNTNSTTNTNTIDTKSETLNIKCDCCYRRFACNGLRDLHVHQAVPSFVKCKLCPTYYADRIDRMEHKKTHKIPKAKQFICPHCGRVHETAESLASHVSVTKPATVLPVSDKAFVRRPAKSRELSFECDLCQRKFTKKLYVEKHLKLHVENKLDCTICSRSFKESRNLQKHMLTHTGEKPFKCSLCEKCFQHESYLTIHMRHHTGERPFVCQQCGKAFFGCSSLTAHIKQIHDKVKNHVCEICSQRFRMPALLRDHIRAKHTLERPYACPECDQTFSTAKTFKQHSFLHKEKKFQCNYCDRKFAQSAGRRGHEKHFHHVN